MAGALELAAGVTAGEWTSRALVAASLQRIRERDGQLGAMTVVFAQPALTTAALLDDELARGRRRSVLHGVPVVLKDLVDVAGCPTAAGSRLMTTAPAAASAVIVQRLQDAGLVILGKTAMTELAFGGWGTSAIAPTPRNPWDPQVHRAPGGSSSGAAVAVAAGLAPLAVGTDTGGSVRIPASLCGLVGLKTTVGAVPREGMVLLSPTLDSPGPLARTAADAAALFAILSGKATGSGPVGAPSRPDPLSELAGCRLGIPEDADLGVMDANVDSAFRQACQSLADAGAVLRPASLGMPLEAYMPPMSVILGYEAWALHGERVVAGAARMDPHVRDRFLAGRQVTQAQYAAALETRRQRMAAVAMVLQYFDAIITPTTPYPAPPLTEVDEGALPLSRYTRAVNYLGLCAVAVPMGYSREGLPLSLQFIGEAGSEHRLLSRAAAWESLRGPMRWPAGPR